MPGVRCATPGFAMQRLRRKDASVAQTTVMVCVPEGVVVNDRVPCEDAVTVATSAPLAMI